MESQIVEKLLDRYFEAETTGTEEERLKAYFTSGEVAPHLQQYIPMFCFFEQAKTEHFSKEISYTPVETRFSAAKRKVYSWVAIAASIVILMGIVAQQENQVSEFGTYEDPELAMQKTREALEMMSIYMNSGTEELGYIEEFNNTKNKIVK